MELPKGWTLVHADRLFAFVTSGSRGWAQYYSEEGSPFIRIGDLSRETLQIDYHSAQRVRPPLDSEGTRTRVQPGDLLISITADLGIVGVVSGDVPEAYINQHIALARPHSSHSSKYIGWYLASWDGGQRQIRSMKRGATKVGLGLEDIRSLVVPLPSRSEQEEIVRVIETQFSRLDTSEARLSRALVNIKRARASVLKAAVEGRLVPTEAELARAEARPFEPGSELLQRISIERRRTWIARYPKKRYSEPIQAECESLPRLPEGWSWATTDQIAWSSGYGTSVKCLPNAEGPPVLRIPNVQRGVIDLDDLKYATVPEELGQDGAVEPGDLIFVRTNGSLRLIGLGATVLHPLSTPTWFASYLIRLRLCGGMGLWRWMTLMWNGPTIRRYVERDAASSAGQFNVSLSAATRYAVPLPPLAEQHRIVAEVDRRLSVLDRLEARITANLSRCKRLRQAILKRAFEGRLVPQEPRDAG